MDGGIHGARKHCINSGLHIWPGGQSWVCNTTKTTVDIKHRLLYARQYRELHVLHRKGNLLPLLSRKCKYILYHPLSSSQKYFYFRIDLTALSAFNSNFELRIQQLFWVISITNCRNSKLFLWKADFGGSWWDSYVKLGKMGPKKNMQILSYYSIRSDKNGWQHARYLLLSFPSSS